MNLLLKITFMAFLVFAIGCKIQKNNVNVFDLIGAWRSDFPQASEVGNVLLELRFLPESNYEIYTMPVGEKSIFVEWGNFKVINNNSVMLFAEFMGSKKEGKITAKDKVEEDTKKQLVQKELRYEITDSDRVRFWFANDPSVHIDFSRISE